MECYQESSIESFIDGDATLGFDLDEFGSSVQAEAIFVTPCSSPTALKTLYATSNTSSVVTSSPSLALASLRHTLQKLGSPPRSPTPISTHSPRSIPSSVDNDSLYDADNEQSDGTSSSSDEAQSDSESDSENDDDLFWQSLNSPRYKPTYPRGWFGPQTRVPFYEKYLPESMQYKTKLREEEERQFEYAQMCENP